jgi:hypothetical protein
LKLSLIINLNIISASEFVLFACHISWIFNILRFLFSETFTYALPVKVLNVLMNLRSYIRMIATIMDPFYPKVSSSGLEDYSS